MSKENENSLVKKIIIYVVAGIVSMVIIGYTLMALLTGMPEYAEKGAKAFWRPGLFLNGQTYLLGLVGVAVIVVLYMVYARPSAAKGKRIMNSKAGDVDNSPLENSHWMSQKEVNDNFPPSKFTQLGDNKKDGIPLYAVYNNKKKELDINIASGMHSIIIGATGSGKTTTFVNPMVQILGHSAAGSSMICTDPKGELFQMHSKMLTDHGYKCMVLDLRDPYSSFRWNPLADFYDRYQIFLSVGEEIYKRTDDPTESGLELVDDVSEYGDIWYEYEGKAYAIRKKLLTAIKIQKQKIYDEIYEDLNDLVSVICPIESQSDPVWEKGARSIIMAVCIAMLEDSEFPELEMTRDKYCFYNVNKIIGNSENEYENLKNYFAGRSKLSKAVGLSRQVLSAAENTLNSYMSIALDKLSMFNDEGLCSLTSNTDIDPAQFAHEPTALFLKIPDEKDTRHALAAVFILCIYKALIKVASAREDLSLPRNVYFILDEFGNMPKIDKFDKMITVGRSRKIWFNMILQSYTQLNNVYGDNIANIVKSNCGFKMFIGSNDINTCEEFSKLCGNTTVNTNSVSSQLQDVHGNFNVSTQMQVRPLIYPSELQKLNNKQSTGNAIVVTFGNDPIKTKFTPSYRCPLYEFATMDMTAVTENAFFGDEVFYDIEERNAIVLADEEADENEGEAAVEQAAAESEE